MPRLRIALLFSSLATLLAALPAPARAGCLPDSIVSDGYLLTPINDDGDQFGTDAGMLCCPVFLPETASDEVPKSVYDVDVTMALTHTFVGDLVFKLKSPEGTISTFLSNPGCSEVADNGVGCNGDSTNWNGSSILFDEQSLGPSAEDMGAILSGTQNVCADNGVCAHTPAHGAGQGLHLDSDFDGEKYAGTWELCVGDDVGFGTGTWDSFTLSVKAHRRIPCVCGGKFRGGDRVRYAPEAGPVPSGDDPNGSTLAPEGQAPPSHAEGEVMCGMINGATEYVLVAWDGFTSGNAGSDLCQCPLGSLPSGATSGYYVRCSELVLDLPWSDDFESGDSDHWTLTATP